jgi:hypothetical protein
MHRLAKNKLLHATRVANAIEFTRFPPSANDSGNEEGMLVRAADLIGQLGDPHYLRKANALYYEFEEVGMNKQLGYDSRYCASQRFYELHRLKGELFLVSTPTDLPEAERCFQIALEIARRQMAIGPRQSRYARRLFLGRQLPHHIALAS